MSRLNLALSVPVLLGAAFGFPGCATTGQSWVQEPENALSVTASPGSERIAMADRESLALVGAAEPSLAPSSEAPRHRLDHVVSLGEGAASAPPSPGVIGSSSAPPTPVVVHIVNYAAPSYGYAAPSYDYAPGYSQSYPRAAHRFSPAGASRVAPVNLAPGGTPPLAHDWQTARSYGPNFPYHTGPASPWERAR
jgi:hypothetical protein